LLARSIIAAFLLSLPAPAGPGIRVAFRPVPPIRDRGDTLVLPATWDLVQVDGSLEDACWAKAPRFGPFETADDRTDAGAETFARLVRRPGELYVAFRCNEPRMDRLQAAYRGWDRPVYRDDSVEVLIDHNAGGRGFLRFVINAIGARYESAGWFGPAGRLFDTKGWDAGWRGSVRRDAKGWTAEVFIPAAAVTGRQDLFEGEVWRVALVRNRVGAVPGGPEVGSAFRFGAGGRPRFRDVAMGRARVQTTLLSAGRIGWGRNRLRLGLANPGDRVRTAAVRLLAGPVPSGGAGRLLLVSRDVPVPPKGRLEVTVPYRIPLPPPSARSGRVRVRLRVRVTDAASGALCFLREYTTSLPREGVRLDLSAEEYLCGEEVVAEGVLRIGGDEASAWRLELAAGPVEGKVRLTWRGRPLQPGFTCRIPTARWPAGACRVSVTLRDGKNRPIGSVTRDFHLEEGW